MAGQTRQIDNHGIGWILADSPADRRSGNRFGIELRLNAALSTGINQRASLLRLPVNDAYAGHSITE
jgi:hypothetical protein